MPRLQTSFLQQARRISPRLVPLLKTCRDLPSAYNELRWLREHVAESLKTYNHSGGHLVGQRAKERHDYRHAEQTLLKYLCVERGRGVPLQYLLGTEYFGELEIECQRGVLIPRPETANIVTELAKRLSNKSTTPRDRGRGEGSTYDDVGLTAGPPANFRILDLCMGTGCMSFLLSHLMLGKDAAFRRHDEGQQVPDLTTQSFGIDIMPGPIRLARRNLRRLYADKSLDPHRSSFTFARADVLAQPSSAAPSRRASTSSSGPDVSTPSSVVTLSSVAPRPRAVGGRKRRRSHLATTATPPSPLHDLLVDAQSPFHTAQHTYTPFDILLANPPYIAPSSYAHSSTARSVRAFEPRAALVPPVSAGGAEPTVVRGDEFYAPILAIARDVDAKVVLMEVGGVEQAMRVAALARAMGHWGGVEVWRDGIAGGGSSGESRMDEVVMLGPVGGEGRAVVCYRGEGRRWMGVGTSEALPSSEDR